MRDFFRKFLPAISVGCMATGLFVFGCTDVDDSLGQEFVPSDQSMRIELGDVNGVKTYVTLYDSIVSSNLGYTYVGRTHDDVFGSTTVGSLMQMVPYSLPDTMAGLGYKPAVDSVKFRMVMSAWGGDTLTAQTINVYKVTKLLGADTTFYSDFPYRDYIDPEPLFTFELKGRPDKSQYKEFKFTELSARQRQYAQALMECDSATYHADSAFIEKFKGLVFAPADASPQDAAIYRIDLEYAFLSLYGHNYWESAPDKKKDTVSLHLSFEDRTILARKSLSVVSIEHDYTGSKVVGINDTLNPVTPVYVQGMAGVTAQLEFPKELFDEIKALRKDPQTEMVINRARLILPLTGGPLPPVENLDLAPQRLGSYTDYAGKVSITDYNYLYEQEYGKELPYGGYLNRSHGYYELDITSFVQRGLLKENAPGRFVIGPDAFAFFKYAQVSLEGYGSDNPMKLELIYTLVR